MEFDVSVGIILAGGSGSRLWPTTLAISKQLVPVAGRPMIYFPLSTLMLAGVREVIIIASPQSLNPLRELLGNGKQFGLKIQYILQETALGIAQGFALAEPLLLGRKSIAILGDNFFFGEGLGTSLRHKFNGARSTTIFVKDVMDVSALGAATLDTEGNVVTLEEKPSVPKTSLAVTGLYIFMGGDLAKVAGLTPSPRGELEIVDLLLAIAADSNLRAERLSKSTFWSDLGTLSSIDFVDGYVRAVESTQSMHVLVPELIAVEQGMVSIKEMRDWLYLQPDSGYKQMLQMRMN